MSPIVSKLGRVVSTIASLIRCLCPRSYFARSFVMLDVQTAKVLEEYR